MLFQKNKKLLALALILLGRAALVNGAVPPNEFTSKKMGSGIKLEFTDQRVTDAADKIYAAFANFKAGGSKIGAVDWKAWGKGGEIYEAIFDALVGRQQIDMTWSTEGAGATAAFASKKTSFKSIGDAVLQQLNKMVKAILAVQQEKGSFDSNKNIIIAAQTKFNEIIGLTYSNNCAAQRLTGQEPGVPPCVEQWSLLKLLGVVLKGFENAVTNSLNEAANASASDLKTLKAPMGRFSANLFDAGTGKNLLLYNTITTSEAGQFKAYMKKFVDFVGTDDKGRAADAKFVSDTYIGLMDNLKKVFWKLGVAQTYSYLARKTGSMKNKEIQATKDERLSTAMRMTKIDVDKIPWFATVPGQDMDVSRMVSPLSNNLAAQISRTNQILENSSADYAKEKCWGKACQERFEFLNYMANFLWVTLDKIQRGIDDLKDKRDIAYAGQQAEAELAKR